MTNYLTEDNLISLSQAVSPLAIALDSPAAPTPPPDVAPRSIRPSLHASTLDGVFATIFSNITGGVLLSNFLVELNASPLQIGMLASIPMVANLLQPLGAYWADRTTSRRTYSLWIYGISRLLWLPLAIGILMFSQHPIDQQMMIVATLGVLTATHFLGAIGSASWLAWLATLVPRRLRGRYFGFRNSTFSLTNLIAIPLLGLAVSRFPGGTIPGFGVMMGLGVVAGLISLGFQSQMQDVNPQASKAHANPPTETADPSPLLETTPEPPAENALLDIFKNAHFLTFLLYFGLWSFGVNLSNPFFNLYLLDNLALNLSWVTLYNGLGAGATLLMLMLWGKLADRVGNRPILLLDGILVAIIPLLWLGTSTDTVSLWLWFPLLHLLGGGAGSAIDLCMNNLQLAIAPVRHHTTYFAITAAIGGVSGALGATAGGWLAQLTASGGITGLFVVSSGLRLLALLPLLWVHEPQSHSLQATMQRLNQQAQDWFQKSKPELSAKG